MADHKEKTRDRDHIPVWDGISEHFEHYGDILCDYLYAFKEFLDYWGY